MSNINKSILIVSCDHDSAKKLILTIEEAFLSVRVNQHYKICSRSNTFNADIAWGVKEAISILDQKYYQFLFIDVGESSLFLTQALIDKFLENENVDTRNIVCWLNNDLNRTQLVRLLKNDINLFCSKNPDIEELQRIFSSTISKQRFLNEGIYQILKQEFINAHSLSVPTATEKQILESIAQDKTNLEIAVDLNIKLSTVKNHIRNLNRKFNTRNRRELLNKTFY